MEDSNAPKHLKFKSYTPRDLALDIIILYRKPLAVLEN